MDGLRDFIDRTRQKQQKVKIKKEIYAFYAGRELIVNAFRSGIFPIKTQGKVLRILTTKCFKDYQ